MACLAICIFAFVPWTWAQTNTQLEYDFLNHTEQSYAMRKNSSGNFVVVASAALSTSPPNQHYGLIFIELDSCLDTIQVKGLVVDGADDPGDQIEAYDIIEHEGNYIVCGRMDVPGVTAGWVAWAMKISTDFLTVSQFRRYKDADFFIAVVPKNDNSGFVFCGGNQDNGGIFLTTDNSLDTPTTGANPSKQRHVPDGLLLDMCRADGDYVVIVGIYYTTDGDQDLLILRIQDDATLGVCRSYDNPDHDPSVEAGYGVTYDDLSQTAYITGRYNSTAGDDVLGVAFNTGGNSITWAQHYDLGGSAEAGSNLLLSNDGDVRIAGHITRPFSGSTSENGFLLQTLTGGDPVDVELYGTSASERLFRIEENGTGNFVMTGHKDNKIYAVQSFLYSHENCSDSLYTIDTADFVPEEMDRDTIENDPQNWTLTSSPYDPLLDIDTTCYGCTDCEPTTAAATYYHVVDTTIDGVLHRMLNEGELYSGPNGSGLVFTHTLSDNNGDILVVNARLNGTVLWSRSYGTSNEEASYCVRGTKDGGFIVAGMTVRGKRNPFLMKLLANGDIDWIKTYEFTYHLGSLKVLELDDGSFVVVSTVDVWNYSQSNDDVVIFKTTSNGTLVRQNILTQSPHRDWDHFTDLVEAGDHIVAVGRGGQATSDDYNPGLMVKFDKQLDIVWVRHYRYQTPSGVYNLDGGANQRSHIKLYAVEYANNKYYAAGVLSNDNDKGASATFRTIVLMEIDPATGKINWRKNYLNTSSRNVFQGYDLRAIPNNGGFIICGNTKVGSEQRSVLVKVNTVGTRQWDYVYGDGKKNMATHVRVASNGKILFTGLHGTDGNNTIRPYFAKVNSNGTGTDVCDGSLTLKDTTINIDTFNVVRDSNIHDSLRAYEFDDDAFCMPATDCDNGSGKWHMNEVDLAGDMIPPVVYPNPVISEGTIRYHVNKTSKVNITLYDMVTGRPVQVIVRDQTQGEGMYELPLAGSDLASGTYICSVTIGDQTHPIKVVLLH